MRKKKLCGLGLSAAFCALLLGGTSAPAPVEANQKIFRTVTPEDNARAQALQKQADEARLAGDYARAIDLYTKAIHINERLGGYDGRAYCRFLLGDYDAAERDASTALHNRSADDLMKTGISGLAEYVHGMCLYKKEQYEEAERDLKAVLGTRYASDEVKTAYADCREKAAAAREAAMLEKFRTSSAAFAARFATRTKACTASAMSGAASCSLTAFAASSTRRTSSTLPSTICTWSTTALRSGARCRWKSCARTSSRCPTGRTGSPTARSTSSGTGASA